MPSLITSRIAGNAVTLSLQVVNAATMLSALRDDVIMQDPDVSTMSTMMMRFITVWNVVSYMLVALLYYCFQLLYFSLALLCDVCTVTNNDYLLPKNIKNMRDTLFSTIVFPGTMLVFTMFWPLYIYDRELIYPAFIDKAFYPISSYVIHMAIVPSVLWEMAYQPRETPKSHTLNVAVAVFYYLVYNALIYHTYFKRGLWPYNLMGILHHGNQIYNVSFHAYVFTLLLSYYFLQWPLKDYFWGKDGAEKKFK